ncbi:hypothetical protein D9V64_02125 [Buchnera aphidicola (Aphis nerii)]|uniref:LysM domain-containing protein n=1 Tax=Buchnera aphidicola (Aphis nerii) TaxID=1241835 RepID=A0A4D6Y333_9GAMM|nr:hypothetical protein D9V64_02125 [Buchnera aphidicola (Aphis nerii)]
MSKRFNYNFKTLLKYNNFDKPYKLLIGQKILVNNISVINNKKINYIIYSDRYKKNILYSNFFKNKLNILNILNRNKSLTKICFFYNTNYNVLRKSTFYNHWYWPLKNLRAQFFYNYSINNKGIEIAGIQGESVFASCKGTVVYVGDFFKNYGNLIIIKHNNNYLSMYGFNKNIFVKLNDEVYAHQKISTMGLSKNNLARLYFEVRLKGNSVNLLSLFPSIKFKKN